MSWTSATSPTSARAGATSEPGTGPAGTPDQVFNEMYREHWRDLYRLATLLSGHPVDGEDLVQEAFAKWYVRRSSVENVGGYLRTTVVNLATGEHRKRARRRKHDHVFETEALRGATSPPIESDPMLEFLNALPARQRAAIVLRYYERCTESEIAQILQCRPGTVKSLLSRGLDALRGKVDRES